MLPFRLALLFALLVNTLQAQQSPIQLRVDLTDAPRHLLHVTEFVPAHAGTNSFSYPQWIQGKHLPAGPIDNLVGLVFHAGSAGGEVLPWRRDLVDLYQFHVEVPAGVRTLAISYDILQVQSRDDTIATNRTSSHVVMLETSDIVLYPSNTPVRGIPITATVHLPANWKAATALRTNETNVAALNGPDTTFRTVSLEQFVDSPILAGDHCRQWPLAPEIRPVHTLDVCAEKSADLELKPVALEHMSALVRQASRLFVGHHFEHYDFLVAASDRFAGDSLEHTQSADYVLKGFGTDEQGNVNFGGSLIPHEFIHSWCGKYRRPIGLATADYHVPLQDDLLWAYEGLTQYYGDVLSARAGIITIPEAVNEFDYEVYNVDQTGRQWRPLQDTADASSILRGTDMAWASWRRGQDYYREGALLWLEADMKIRELSGGKKSLDDFAALFFGAGGDTGPGVKSYAFADVVQGLNGIAPYDWAGFWTTRLTALTAAPPTAGLDAAGYRYADSDTMSPSEADYVQAEHSADMLHSLGFFVEKGGTLSDVWINSPAYKAGLGPGDKLATVNAQPYSSELLIKAVRDAKTSSAPLVFTAVRDDETGTYSINYHGGEKYAALQRNGNPDVLTTSILKPR